MRKRIIFPLAGILALFLLALAALAGEKRGEITIVFGNDVRGETEPCG